VRLTRLVCLPCQPSPAWAARGFSITGAVSTKTFSSLPLNACAIQPAERLEPLLHDVVIVAPWA
jgi:hypothetical protein